MYHAWHITDFVLSGIYRQFFKIHFENLHKFLLSDEKLSDWPTSWIRREKIFWDNKENQWFCCRTMLVFKLQMWRNSYHGVDGGFFPMHLGWEAFLYYGIFLGGWISSQCILNEKSCVTETGELLQAALVANVITAMGNCFTWSWDCKLFYIQLGRELFLHVIYILQLSPYDYHLFLTRE